MSEIENNLTISQIYAKGREKLAAVGYKMGIAPDSLTGSTDQANRKYLDSLFFKTRFLNPVVVDTRVELFGVKLKTPVFCSPMSGFNRLSKNASIDIANGLKNAGSLMVPGNRRLR
jgi:isopentenyl diphosphate isomerase/L-lactate dehydrogenase-like FMN-dependent dehydrogenase